ncbi:MAG: trypsin-like peptidase domain-containing protein [Burkholderiales bacterium]
MTIRKLWLIFAQAATVALAALFAVTTLKPEWFAPRAVERAAPVVIERPAPAPASGARPASYHDAVTKAAPAVVNVFTTGSAKGGRRPFPDDPLFRRYFGDTLGEDRPASSLGSGVIISPKGYVLTNNHVVEGMDRIEVLLADGRTRLGAKLVGSDVETDLAVLKIDRDDLPAITLGAPESVRIGDVVLAIGNPFGVGQTVTLGIVSALGRAGLPIDTTYQNFIQTDAAINVGNSGGALVDAAGNLIGINTAIFASSSGGSIGIGFAIPISTARTVMEQIIADGSVTRGYVGIHAQEMTPDLAESLKISGGVLIAGVERNGPAEKGGVKPGDVLVAVNGRATRDPAAMLDAVAALAPGSQATLRLRRSQGELDAVVTVARRPPAQRRPPAR